MNESDKSLEYVLSEMLARPHEAKNIAIDKACKMAGISKTSFYRIDKDIEAQQLNKKL